MSHNNYDDSWTKRRKRRELSEAIFNKKMSAINIIWASVALLLTIIYSIFIVMLVTSLMCIWFIVLFIYYYRAEQIRRNRLVVEEL